MIGESTYSAHSVLVKDLSESQVLFISSQVKRLMRDMQEGASTSDRNTSLLVQSARQQLDRLFKLRSSRAYSERDSVTRNEAKDSELRLLNTILRCLEQIAGAALDVTKTLDDTSTNSTLDATGTEQCVAPMESFHGIHLTVDPSPAMEHPCPLDSMVNWLDEE